MSWNCVEQKNVTTRKIHSCSICGEKFPIESFVVFRKGVNEDGWASMYMHHECEEFSSTTFDYDDWDNCFPGDISRQEVLDWTEERRSNG